MPPRAIFSSVSSAIVERVADRRVRCTGAAGTRASSAAGTWARRRSRRACGRTLAGERAAWPRRACGVDRARRRLGAIAWLACISWRICFGVLGDLAAALCTASATACSTSRNAGMPWRRLGREVGAAVERHALRRQEHGHRPAAVPGHGLHGLHVDGVEVGALLAVDLDIDESSFISAAVASFSNDSCSITWHQWQAE